MQKKQKILTLLGAVVLLGAGYFLYEHFTYATTDNAQIEAHSVMLAPKVNGFIRAVNVTEGQHVEKDDVLVEIDPRDFENTLRQAKGELTSIEARKRDAEKNFRRLEDLVSKGAVSQQQFDSASTAFAESRAKFEAISAQVAQAELNLANTKIRAPAAGLIARKSAEVGQLAAPGVPLVGFVSSESRWVTANFKETEVADIKVGATVDISVDALSGRSFRGKVAAISSATGATFTLLPPDNATGNFTKVVQRVPVKIEFENLAPEQIETLRAGLSAFIKVRK